MVKLIRRRTLVVAAVVLFVASLGSSANARVSAPTSTAATTISLGTKDFTEEFVLGQLYRQSLEHKGITVDSHENIGRTEATQAAPGSVNINGYPEYVGE